ncbi:Aconitase/3-isopropylmalate dehydratase, swivel [Sesbania bispinosa]|nr:Aconitase/3-isopropylmalate dehydratase, swivel [Sesbania bispinosa]
MEPPGLQGIKDCYCLLNFGDGATSDHISPPRSTHKNSPAAKYLLQHVNLPKKVGNIKPGQEDVNVTTDTDKSFTCKLCLDTKVELTYIDHGGILPHVI